MGFVHCYDEWFNSLNTFYGSIKEKLNINAGKSTEASAKNV